MSVEIEGLVKRYGEATVVKGVSLSIAAGEIFTLLGPSGCGKTTTLRMIAGLESPDAGQIRIEGREVVGRGGIVPPEQRSVGMVFQSFAVWPHKTVLENVAYPLRLRRAPDAEAQAQAALEKVRLGAFAGRYPHTMSGGQQQRVSIARALVAKPAVLLLDEPLSALDAKLREELREEIVALARAARLTVVLVSHDQEEALSMSDRIGVMHAGVLEQVGTPQEIYHHPATPFVARFVGTLNALDGVQAGGVVRVAGVAVEVEGEGPDGPVLVGFRPEDARFVARDGIPCRVARAAFRGAVTRYTVRVEGGVGSGGDGAGEVEVDSAAPPPVSSPGLQLVRAWRL